MTNTTAHTPGPWWVYNEGSRFPGIEAGLNGRNFSVVVYGNDNEIEGVKGRTHAEAIANARLIAAAPELLEALEHYLIQDEIAEGYGGGVGGSAREQARAAIAKATGEHHEQ